MALTVPLCLLIYLSPKPTGRFKYSRLCGDYLASEFYHFTSFQSKERTMKQLWIAVHHYNEQVDLYPFCWEPENTRPDEKHVAKTFDIEVSETMGERVEIHGPFVRIETMR